MKSLYVKAINLGLPHGLLCFFPDGPSSFLLARICLFILQNKLVVSSAPHIQNLVVKYHERKTHN